MRPVVTAVTAAYEMSETAMLTSTRRTASQARSVCAWLAVKLGYRMSQGEIAEVLGRSKTAVSNAIDMVDKLRVTDAWVKDLTDRLLAELGT